ncbi:zinc-dependent peptidase [uncultured Winogradskyella sp.]|uniref:zinc-dependent peptidase n=1 Tax=uncultured Winogradskyella sp. TaxID=395353 RepID=UPI00260CBD2E|nr:zinc-dependent peptidase [uncultured Winogradskyella sp.]
MNPILKLIFIIVLLVTIASVVLSRLYIYFEQVYAFKYKKPFFLNISISKRSLTEKQIIILEREFNFYKILNVKEQKIFRHRLARFIANKVFIGREGIEPTEEMKTLISATAVMLTFGFRNYLIDLIDKVIIYPKAYYSQINETNHKGETNPKLKSIVFSWEDFEQGYHIGDDNLNLGIHEFGHAIHLNAFVNNDISSKIFRQGFEDLINFLQHHKMVREDLIASKYFREYAYTNHYEFFAVILENFIETPKAFKSQFPKLYAHMKQMLNFNFAGY